VPFLIEPRAYADADVQRLIADVQAEYVVRYGGPDESPVEPHEFDPPHGLFLVGLLGGLPIATGAWRHVDATTGELKRMYVAVGHRRRGLSRLMLAEIERTAAAAGLDRLVLNTGTEQPEAIALYRSSGYRPSAAYGIYACAPGALFFEKALRAVVTSAEGSRA
jgi:GNAT superfamily N-acetyltransferase